MFYTYFQIKVKMSTEVIIFSSLIGLFVVLGLIISIVVYFYYKRKRERYKY